MDRPVTAAEMDLRPTPQTADQAGHDARAEIVALHQALWTRQEKLIRARVQGPPGFKAYEARVRKRLRTFERRATVGEVVLRARQSDVVYVGDYHTLKQSQRAFLKLARRLSHGTRPLVLALELVEARHQAVLDRYVAGRISEAVFLSKTGLRARHAFDIWPNFKPILELARAAKLPVVALERANGGTLAERDAFWAKRIAGALKSFPGARVLVLAGQLHVAPPHLPAQVKALVPASDKGLRELVVYQNADTVYWALERAGVEHETEAVRLGAGEYCLVNTPPPVVQQSFLDWVDDDGDGEPDDEALVERAQPERHFKEAAKLIARFLRLDVGDALERVRVHTAGELDFFEDLRNSGKFSRRELGQLRSHILSRESCYVPRARLAYLATLSLNHAAEEAAHCLRHVVTGDEEPDHGLVDAFYVRALEEAFAFFGSKIVNPRRKAPTEVKLKAQLRSKLSGERAVAELVLAHKGLERGQPSRHVRRAYSEPDQETFNAVTHALGYILGNAMYYAMVTGVVTRAEARTWFQSKLHSPGEAAALYFEIAERLRDVKLPRAS